MYDTALSFATTYAVLIGVAGTCVLIFAVGFMYGASNIRALALSVPTAGFLFLYTPDEIITLIAQSLPYAEHIIFAAYLLGAFLLMRRFNSSGGLFRENGRVTMTSVALILLLNVSIYHIVPLPIVTDALPAWCDTVFAAPTHGFWVALLALTLLFVV